MKNRQYKSGRERTLTLVGVETFQGLFGQSVPIVVARDGTMVPIARELVRKVKNGIRARYYVARGVRDNSVFGSSSPASSSVESYAWTYFSVASSVSARKMGVSQ
jgi:hypothetical protein